MGVFYDEDGMIRSHNLDWIYHAMNVLVGIFRSYGLEVNVAKSQKMTCQPSALEVGMLKEATELK